MGRRYFIWIVLAILIAFPFGAKTLYSSFYIALLTRIFIFAIIVIGYDLLAGYTGMISYGHALFFGTGAYVLGMLLKHWTPWFWPPMAMTILASALVAYVVGRLAFQPGRYILSSSPSLSPSSSLWLLTVGISSVPPTDCPAYPNPSCFPD